MLRRLWASPVHCLLWLGLFYLLGMLYIHNDTEVLSWQKQLWSLWTLLGLWGRGDWGVRFCQVSWGLVTAHSVVVLSGSSSSCLFRGSLVEGSLCKQLPRVQAQEQSFESKAVSLSHLETSEEIGQMPTLSSVFSPQKYKKCKREEGCPWGFLVSSSMTCPSQLYVQSAPRLTHCNFSEASWVNFLDLQNICWLIWERDQIIKTLNYKHLKTHDPIKNTWHFTVGLFRQNGLLFPSLFTYPFHGFLVVTTTTLLVSIAG